MQPSGNPFLDSYMQSKHYGMSPKQIINAKFGQAQTTAPKGNQLASVLPSLLATGASFIPGVGSVAAAGLGGIGEIARQKISGEDFDLGKVGQEAALSAVPFGLGKVAKLAKAGATAAKGVNVTSKGLKAGTKLEEALAQVAKPNLVQRTASKMGEDLAIRGVKATPSQLTNFATQHGEDLTKTLARHKLEGASAEQIYAKAIKPQQDAFDAVVKSTAVPVTHTAIQAQIRAVTKPLLNSTLTEEKALGQKIIQESEDILKRFKGGKLTLADATALRKTYDKATRTFTGDPVLEGKNRAIGTILRNTIQTTAEKAGLKAAGGQSVKESGRELSKLYDLHKIAAKQENLGRGSNPLGIIPSIAAGAGGTLGGLPGAIAGLAGAKVLNSRPVIRGASKAATAIGDGATGLGAKLGNNPLVKGGKAFAAQELVRLPFQDAPQPDPSVDPSLAADFTPDAQAVEDPTMQPAAQGSLTPEMIQSAYQQIMAEPDATRRKSMIAELKSLVDLQDTMNPAAKAAKPLSAEASKQVANATSGLKAINQLQASLKADPNLANKNAAAGLLGNIGQGAAGTQSFEAAKNEIIDVISRSRSGAALTPSEIANYKRALPRYGDSPEVAQQKLARFQDLFAQMLELQSQGSPDTEALGLTGAGL